MMRPVKSRNGNSLTAKKAEPPWRARTVISVFSFTGICREKNAEEMKTEIHLVFCVLAVLPYLQQTEGQSSAEPLVRSSTAPLSHAGTSATPDLTKDPGGEVPQRTHNLAGGNETSTGAAAVTEAEAALPSETVTDEVFQASTPHVTASVATSAPTGTVSPSAAVDSLSSAPRAQSTTPLQRVSTTEGHTREPLITFSSQTTHPVQDTGSTAPSTAQPQSESMTTASTQTTGHPLASAAGWGPAGPTHREVPSELNVGDEDLKGPHYRSSSPLDPLLAGLLSVFIITTAIVFVVLFLKFRQRTNNPEFHRLQDLPMDDLMEDTPLSRYTY